MNMKCPVCGAAELIPDVRDLPYTYKGEITLIPAVTGEFCPACAESILEAAESKRVMREMRALLAAGQRRDRRSGLHHPGAQETSEGDP
jgi:YgiT-type zinc finger domain-containing protein